MLHDVNENRGIDVDELFMKCTNRQKKNSSLIDLFDICVVEWGGKIIDYNPDYRYVYFENIKEFYKRGLTELIMPNEWECVEYNWILKDEYIDMLPNIIMQFNKICKFKVMWNIQQK